MMSPEKRRPTTAPTNSGRQPTRGSAKNNPHLGGSDADDPPLSAGLDQLTRKKAGLIQDPSIYIWCDRILNTINDGRSGTFVIGYDHFAVSLVDLPCTVESFKTYDDRYGGL
ncbi:hypothetical protein Dsin_011560 [Dipteronia sinensis]|uniref:TAFII55 protein conserved region domain-containing protein n=1 Tax=Dipteronia sinensis TaxID=43782 RepID=A0AAE0AVI9_9ROSI|nr:hypothetical protein Dsin_011560 [Dipteronia sinensis]